jgi:hypothetical protein
MWMGHSPDLNHEVKVCTAGDDQVVVIDGQAGPAFKAIAFGGLTFSPDARHLAYPALDENQWKVVLDGVPGRGHDGIAELAFSADGKQLAYSALQDSLWYIFTDTWSSTPFDSLTSGSLQFQDDGSVLVYAGWRQGKCRMVHYDAQQGEVSGPPFDWISPSGFKDFGRVLHYVGHDLEGDHLMVGGKCVASAARIKGALVRDEGLTVAFAELVEGRWRIRHNDHPGPWFSNINDLDYNRKTGVVGYIATTETGQMVIQGPDSGKIWPRIEEFKFSPEGARSGWIARNADGQCLVFVNGLQAGKNQWSGNLELADTGMEYAFLAKNEAGWMVKTGWGDTPFDLVIDGSLVLSPNGKHWGCLAGDMAERTLFLAVDGVNAGIDFSWAAYISKVSLHPDAYIIAENNDDYFRAWVTAGMKKAK